MCIEKISLSFLICAKFASLSLHKNVQGDKKTKENKKNIMIVPISTCQQM